MQAKLPFLRLLSVPPFYAGIPESASRITRFVLAAIITDSSKLLISPISFMFSRKRRFSLLVLCISLTSLDGGAIAAPVSAS